MNSEKQKEQIMKVYTEELSLPPPAYEGHIENLIHDAKQYILLSPKKNNLNENLKIKKVMKFVIKKKHDLKSIESQTKETTQTLYKPTTQTPEEFQEEENFFALILPTNPIPIHKKNLTNSTTLKGEFESKDKKQRNNNFEKEKQRNKNMDHMSLIQTVLDKLSNNGVDYEDFLQFLLYETRYDQWKIAAENSLLKIKENSKIKKMKISLDLNKNPLINSALNQHHHQRSSVDEKNSKELFRDMYEKVENPSEAKYLLEGLLQEAIRAYEIKKSKEPIKSKL